MSDLPQTFTEPQDLPPDLSGDVEQARVDLAEKGYKVMLGLNQSYAEALISMTLEPHIKQNCPNDSGKRFVNLETTRLWLTKNGGRAVFLLVRLSDNALAGYGWAGAGGVPEVEGGKFTFAVRVGEIGLGKRLSTSFCTIIVQGSAALYGVADFWLETWMNSESAIHAYHHVGFQNVTHIETDHGTRLFMRYPNELLPKK
jgi:hypothetical protein